MIGSFYNCAITIIDDPHDGKGRFITEQLSKTQPTKPGLQNGMNKPFQPFVRYFSIESSPPVMKGWCNFADPAVIKPCEQTPTRQLLRDCPDSAGREPPLVHGRKTRRHG